MNANNKAVLEFGIFAVIMVAYIMIAGWLRLNWDFAPSDSPKSSSSIVRAR